MKRDYASGTDTNVDLFVGTEVEHTPALGMSTLFVVGLQHPEQIDAMCRERDIKHIYLGANQCFTVDKIDEYESMAQALLAMDYWVTLDIDANHYQACCDALAGLSSHDRFIVMISVRLPYLTNLNYHASVKIDDRDFRSTNPGVWVHQLHDLMDRSRFTDWSSYGQDEIIRVDHDK